VDPVPTHDAGTRLDQWYRSVSEPVARLIAPWRGVTPNRVSVAAFVAGGPVTAALVLTDHFVLAGIAYIISDLLDYVDGDVARAQGTMSERGDILDGILDRLTDFMSLASLLLRGSGVVGDEPMSAAGIGVPSSTVVILVGVAALCGSVMPSYIRALAVANGARTAQSIGGRGTRNRIVYVGLLVAQPLWTLGVIAVLAWVATVHRGVVSFSSAAPGRRS
jgi:phosphatidylglycerophosphate synthase